MNQIELFAGIGGFGLAGRWAGIETICQVEIDPFCQKVLQKNFPNAERHADIKNFDGTKYFGTVDIISGGFPCQPFSSAGKRLGEKDERHLWPEMLRVIREVYPRWIVGENVSALINHEKGMVFEQICADLEDNEYQVQPFVLPACGVNAPHRRDRVWFVAYSNGSGRKKHNPSAVSNWPGFNSGNVSGIWEKWTSEPAICGMDDGISAGLDKHRNKRIKALGNAIVPQVAYQIFSAIKQLEE